MRLWGGRFSEANDARVEAFTSSIDIDRELAADDLAGSIAHVHGLGSRRAADRRAGRRAGRRPDRAGRGRRRRPVHLGPRPRGRPPQPRVGPRRADRAGRRAAAHRSLAQRPGRHRPAAVDAPGHRPPGRRARSTSSARSSSWPSARARPSCPGRPTSSPPSRSCSPITCWPTSRWPSATGPASPTRGGGSTSRRWVPGRWPVPATRWTARRPPRSSASRASRPTRWTP